MGTPQVCFQVVPPPPPPPPRPPGGHWQAPKLKVNSTVFAKFASSLNLACTSREVIGGPYVGCSPREGAAFPFFLPRPFGEGLGCSGAMFLAMASCTFLAALSSALRCFPASCKHKHVCWVATKQTRYERESQLCGLSCLCCASASSKHRCDLPVSVPDIQAGSNTHMVELFFDRHAGLIFWHPALKNASRIVERVLVFRLDMHQQHLVSASRLPA